jgi:hypothetical protein
MRSIIYFIVLAMQTIGTGMPVTIIFSSFYLEGHITRKLTLKKKRKKSMNKKLRP